MNARHRGAATPGSSTSGGVLMSMNGHTDARKLRASLGHPVIDADGHWIEHTPVMREEFRKIAGKAAVEALAFATQRVPNSLGMSVAERRRRRVGQEVFYLGCEADELVEHGMISSGDFRDFMFANAVRFWGEVNPDFF